MRYARAFIDPGEYEEIKDSEKQLVLCVVVDLEGKTVTAFYSDGSCRAEGFYRFRTSGDGTAPEFDKPEVIDHGHTVALGKYGCDASNIGFYQGP